MARIRWLVCVSALLWSATSLGASRLPASFPRIRPLGEHAALTVQRGVSHSPTFREIAARLERSDVVVYVSIETRPPGRCAGATRFVAATPRLRFLHIALDPDLAPKELVALLAHELQHAIEVADAPEVRDLDSFRQYYEQHGLQDQRVGTYDSQAARETGRRVRAELASAPPETAWIG